ncbi:MAG: hypothetical protein MK188_09310 [Gammaproteobacteria bacterium]|nr:hypothetical protein [Gammaproteobacteria bacterium]
MSDTMSKNSKEKNLQTILERGAEEAKSSRKAKRLAQHQHWMRVMMEGQATPDLTYQKPKV